MTVSLKANHLKRYKDVAYLLVKYGILNRDQARLVDCAELSDPQASSAQMTHTESRSQVHQADQLAKDVTKLGPTFIRLGQHIAGRADLLPQTYLNGLAHLDSQSEAMPLSGVIKVIETELGQPYDARRNSIQYIRLSGFCHALLSRCRRWWIRTGN